MSEGLFAILLYNDIPNIATSNPHVEPATTPTAIFSLKPQGTQLIGYGGGGEISTVGGLIGLPKGGGISDRFIFTHC